MGVVVQAGEPTDFRPRRAHSRSCDRGSFVGGYDS